MHSRCNLGRETPYIGQMRRGDTRAKQNDSHNDDSGQALDAAIAIGECRGGLAPREHEADPRRNSCRRIGNVVDGIREQRQAAQGQLYQDLEGSSESEDDDRPLDRLNAALRGGYGRIDDTMGAPLRSVVGVIMAMPVMIVQG
jgi:hypothetical protein